MARQVDMETLPRFLSITEAVLTVNGGPLTNLYDSNKWDMPGNRSTPRKSWKSYRVSKARRSRVM